jgi:hypothetical protein
VPALIQAIEAGAYPEQQIGYYDLKLEGWLNVGAADSSGNVIFRGKA